MLRKVISQLKPSTCLLDPITTTFRTALNCIFEELQAIAKHSLLTGTFPTVLKTAMVKHLLKKSQIDYSALIKCRPISKLPFLS
jgi:hypothetical protein